MRIVVRCPAKINRFLSVGPLDSRGYHPLRTIFQAISLHDTVTIETGATGFSCDWPDMPEENTMTKSLRLLSEYRDLPPVSLTLAKRIPAESGLGGGSSNAAGVLRGMQKVLAAPLEDRELHDIAAAVGADVPFFLIGGRAKGEGYGTRLTPLPDAPPEWLVVARPEVGVSTKEAYACLDARPYEWQPFPEDDALYNDFERVAPCECLDLIERLQVRGAERAGLSGSGSAVFGIFRSEEGAQSSADGLRGERVPFVEVATTLSRAESLAVEVA